MAVSGRTPPRELAETLASYERGEINVLINAQLLAEGWNSPRATVCMHLAPTASKRVYQQRVGRIMRTHPRKEAGIVVDFVPKGATHSERVVSLHSLARLGLLPRRGARHARPAPPLRTARAPPAVAGSLARSGHAGRGAAPRRHPARVAAGRPAIPRRRRATLLGDDRRPPDPVRPARGVRAQVRRGTSRQGRARDVPLGLRCREPEPQAPDDRPRRPRRDTRRPGRLRRPRDPRHAGAALGEGSRGGCPHPAAGDRRREGERSGADPRALDVAPRPLGEKDARSEGKPGVPRGEAAPRRRRELTRPSARGQRRTAREDRSRAAAPRRRGAARVRGGIHPARERHARPCARGARPDRGDRGGSRREPAGPEDACPQVAPSATQEAPRAGRGPGDGDDGQTQPASTEQTQNEQTGPAPDVVPGSVAEPASPES